MHCHYDSSFLPSTLHLSHTLTVAVSGDKHSHVVDCISRCTYIHNHMMYYHYYPVLRCPTMMMMLMRELSPSLPSARHYHCV